MITTNNRAKLRFSGLSSYPHLFQIRHRDYIFIHADQAPKWFVCKEILSNLENEIHKYVKKGENCIFTGERMGKENSIEIGSEYHLYLSVSVLNMYFYEQQC